MENRIISYVEIAVSKGASDIHIKSGCLPMIRIEGDIIPMKDEPIIENKDIVEFLKNFTGVSTDGIEQSPTAVDFSFTYGGVRFRGNVYKDNNGLGFALRILQLLKANFESLGIPLILKELAKKRSGLILVTGPTGSGKTTTLTYLLDYINETQAKHIIMIEDPIEYLHESSKCVFTQREVGRDTKSFGDAITEAMREDPDMIMVGEMRDETSVEAALRAAETGHLVFSTLHTKGAANSITRIVDVFATDRQNQIRTQLSMSLLAVVSQQLCPGVNGSRHLATEIMVSNNAIRAAIKQDRLHLIPSIIQTSAADGMYAMKSSLQKLLQEGKITQQTYESYQI